MMIKFYDFAIHGKMMKLESTETGIKQFRLKIREKSLFQKQQKFEQNLGKNKEQSD